LGRAPLSLLVSLLVLTGAAWALTLYQTLSMSMPMGIAARGGLTAEGMGGMAMAGMSAAGWSLGGAALFVAVWTVMMAAMMLPATAPMILIFASAQARRERDAAVPTWIFTAGYILVWLAAGLLVYVLVQIGSDMATRLTSADRASWAPLALGATLVAGGLYQFTPIKRICLTHCRSPFAFVAQHWRDGPIGALRMGLRHGAYCLGCCWALFAVLVAAGVMSLAWMLLLTLVVFVEKVLPQGRRASAVIGVALVVLGPVVASGAVSMPWIV
jgi:predicted metal-binding membrane protein